jgi:hypothetical protein
MIALWVRRLVVVAILCVAFFTSREAGASSCCPVTSSACVARPGHSNPACQAGTQQEVKEAGSACDCCEFLCLFDCTGCLIGPIGGCEPNIATGSVTDTCNGVDDDCDGLVDEDQPPTTEVCDGVDNNCNGAVDEQFPFSVTCGAAGACAGSQTFTCVGGVPDATPCVGAIEVDSVPDICNGDDDDCDGLTDEDEPPTAEVCDGIDNNCNGAVDEQFPFSVTCGAAGTCAGSQTFTCVGGVPGATACTGVSAPEPEIPDGYDNDCDGQTDECDGPGDFWCNCAGGEVVFPVDRLDDGSDVEAEAAACRPSAQSTGNCRLRGVFRRAEQLDFVGCRAVAELPFGTVVIDAELRLQHGTLTVRGAGGGACSSVITTQSPCAKDDCKCDNGSRYRLVNAIRDGGQTLALTFDGVTLRGGKSHPEGDFTPWTAAGGIVIDEGDLTLLRSVVEDNRARGHGAGIASYDGGLLRIVDSVIRNNMNIQAVPPGTGECFASEISGGLTGPGGGIFALRTQSIVIENSAITGNAAADAGGLYVVGGALSMTNTTVSGNRSGGYGGGLFSLAASTTLAFTTFSENIAGQHAGNNDSRTGGLRIASGSLVAYGNIFAQNAIGAEDQPAAFGFSADCSIDTDVTVTAGTNLIGDGGDDCEALGPISSPLIGPNPGSSLPLDAMLSPLPETACASSATSVHAAGASSPATGAYPAGSSPGCLADDQRRFGRPAGSACTLGAYEVAGVAAFRRLELTSCVYAEQLLTLRDRALVDGDAFAGSFSFANDARLVGGLLSVGSGSLGDRAVVERDAALGGQLFGNEAGVLGELLEEVAVPAQSLAPRPVSSSGTNLTVASGTTQPLGSGAYGHVVVRSNATLRLTQSGLYRFASLTFEPDATLDVLASADDVALAAAGNVVFGDRFVMGVGGQSSPNVPGIFVYSNGSRIELGHDAFIVGTLEAPDGNIELRDRSTVVGCAGGLSVTVGHDASVGNGSPSLAPLPPWPSL